ncbi:MAG TPA: ABC transporter ATP-binding protein [Cytophagaceae bacterium]|jgi:ABC-type polysaccharide/polyol phosphate transport system ATPase subunit|nr:ABC transporter ATP-binding protein [Cytophagaceae bacterium]
MSASKREIAIKAEGLEVSFLIQKQGLSSIKQYLMSFGGQKMFEKKTILKGVNIEIYKGECFGLLGKNGSGKSTLLRTLAGIITPEKGTVTINGRIAPLLALGVGLEMEMSGIENIKLCCTLMGLSKKEIKQSLPAIVDFSELGKDVNMQVKRYSSGMMARLAFSMVVATNPEILVVDEALAVGDMGFQNKCMARINELRESGATIIYVSHNHEEIKKLCNRAAWLKNGVIEKTGDVNEVGEAYIEQFS